MELYKLAKELAVRSQVIQRFLEERGFGSFLPEMRLPSGAIEEVRRKFQRTRTPAQKSLSAVTESSASRADQSSQERLRESPDDDADFPGYESEVEEGSLESLLDEMLGPDIAEISTELSVVKDLLEDDEDSSDSEDEEPVAVQTPKTLPETPAGEEEDWDSDQETPAAGAAESGPDGGLEIDVDTPHPIGESAGDSEQTRNAFAVKTPDAAFPETASTEAPAPEAGISGKGASKESDIHAAETGFSVLDDFSEEPEGLSSSGTLADLEQTSRKGEEDGDELKTPPEPSRSPQNEDEELAKLLASLGLNEDDVRDLDEPDETDGETPLARSSPVRSESPGDMSGDDDMQILQAAMRGHGKGRIPRPGEIGEDEKIERDETSLDMLLGALESAVEEQEASGSLESGPGELEQLLASVSSDVQDVSLSDTEENLETETDLSARLGGAHVLAPPGHLRYQPDSWGEEGSTSWEESPGRASALSPKIIRAAFGELVSRLGPVQRILLCGMMALLLAFVFVGGLSSYAKRRPGRDEVLWTRGNNLYELGQYDQAQVQFTEISKHFPESRHYKESLYRICECLYQQGRYGEVLAGLTRLQEYLDQQTETIDDIEYPAFTLKGPGEMMRARCEEEVGRYDEARRDYTRIAEREPDTPLGREATLALGSLLNRIGSERESNWAYREAVERYSEFVAKNPEEARISEAFAGIGRAYEGLALLEPKKYLEYQGLALANFEDARRTSQARNLEVLLSIGRVHEALEHWESAEKVYRSILEGSRVPGFSANAHIGRARALHRMRHSQEALRELELVLREEPGEERTVDETAYVAGLFLKGDITWDLGLYSQMLSAYAEALRLEERDRDHYGQRAHMRITNVLFTQEKDYAGAADHYREILKRYPDGAYAQLAQIGLADSLFQIGEYEDAAEAYQTVIDDYPFLRYRDPKIFIDAYYKKADALLAAGDRTEAVEALGDAIRDLGYPSDGRALEARRRLAGLYAEEGYYEQAVRVYRNLLVRFPESDPDGEIAMEMARVQEAWFDYPGARETYRKIIRDHDGTPAAREAAFLLGRNLRTNADVESAEVRELLRSAAMIQFERCLLEVPEDPSPLLEIGRIHHSNGDFSRAVQYLRRYLSSRGTLDATQEAHFLIGNSNYRLGDYEGSISDLTLVGEDVGRERFIQALFELADSYKRVGRTQEATQLFREIAEKFPSTDWGKDAELECANLNWEATKPGVGTVN